MPVQQSDLALLAGLEVAWTDNGLLRFGEAVRIDESLTRPLSRLKRVALDPEACVPEDKIQYWMYNGVATADERDRLMRTGMRYELTLMPPLSIGREHAKTLGHLHSFPPAGRLNYPEVCEILHGTANFIFQTMNTQTGEANFCATIEARPGDKIIIPPNVHHLTINAGDDPLLFSDAIPLAVSGNYEPLATMHGAAYYLTTDAGYIPNPAYRSVPTLERWEKASDASLSNRPLYQLFSETPEALAWMTEPERFPNVFPGLWERVAPYIDLS